MLTRTNEEDHFESLLQQADLLRQENKYQEYTAALQQLITEQAQFYASPTHPNILKSYHLLAAANGMCQDLTNTYAALKHAWKIESHLHLPSAEQTKNEMRKVSKLLKIQERIATLKSFPAYNWCKHTTGIEYQKHLIKINELFVKLFHHKEFMTPQQIHFVAQQCYMMGTYYNHDKGSATNALKFLNAALGNIESGYPAIWLQLQIAYQTQFTLSKTKHDNTKSPDEKIAIAAATSIECLAIVAQCVEACNDIPSAQQQPGVVSKISLFAKYIAALIKFQLAEIYPREIYQEHLKSALEKLQVGLQAGVFDDLEDDLTLRSKSLVAYALTIMESPPTSPKTIYEELTTFLLRDPGLKHPEAAKIFVHYGKYLRKEYKKDITKSELITEMLEKYQKAHLSLIMTGRENSPLEIEVSKYIQHLEHKLLHRATGSNYSPRLFTPLAMPLAGSLDSTFSLDNSSSLSSSSSSSSPPRPAARSTIMKAIILKKFGGPEVLEVSEIPQPEPGPEQILVRVKACALNRADLLQRRGKYAPPAGESDILGLEIAGNIALLGANVKNFKIGERIFGLVASGAYAEYCLLDQGMAMRIPEKFSYQEAASIPEAFLTAQEAVFTLGQLQPKESILIHAGGSGVGSAAIQLARQVDAKIFTTTSDETKFAKISAFGADEILNYKKQDFAAEIFRLTNDEGVDVIIDFVGAVYLAQHLRLLQTAGRMTLVGAMGGNKSEIDIDPIRVKRLQIKGLMMRFRPLAEKRLITQHFQEKWLPLFNNGKLVPVIDTVFDYQEVQAAHEHMENNRNVGKIILNFNE